MIFFLIIIKMNQEQYGLDFSKVGIKGSIYVSHHFTLWDIFMETQYIILI